MKYEKSNEMYKRALQSMPGGVSSNVRLAETPHPLYFESASASHITDVDGNQYVDYVLGQGPMIFGHSPSFLLDAVAEASQKGQLIAGQHGLEIEVAELVCQLVPCADVVRFASSGTEAVQAAIRVARAFTERNIIVRFEGHYHGWSDSLFFDTDHSGNAEPQPLSLGISENALADVAVLPWNDFEAIQEMFKINGDKIAAVITEPVMCNTNCIMPRTGYLEYLRELTSQNRSLLIFDEVITGFRMGKGGAQEYFGVLPDLSTFAKAMAGGYPLSMVCGRREVMDLIGTGKVMHGGTANANMMSMAAGKAALDRIKDGNTIESLDSIGHRLMAGLRNLNMKYELGMSVQGPGPMFAVSFTGGKEIMDARTHSSYSDTKLYDEFVDGMMKEGVRVVGRGMWFISESLTEEDLELTLSVADSVLRKIVR